MNTLSQFETTVGGRAFQVETGKLAGQANGAVRVQYGDTVVLATATMAESPRVGASFFPLTVEVDEKLYAAGRIKGSRWIKREGRPTDEAILTARLIDRTLRPLFNKYMRQEVQVIVTVLSFDNENDPDIPAIVACSLALGISNIPWQGPLGAVRVGYAEGAYLINPTYEQRESEALDLVISGPEGMVNMLEGRGNEVSEKTVSEAIRFADKERKNLIEFQRSIIEKVGRPPVKVTLTEPREEIAEAAQSLLAGRLEGAFFTETTGERNNALRALQGEITSELSVRFPEEPSVKEQVEIIFEKELDRALQASVLDKKRRVDGRALDEIRTLRAEVGLLPRTHGSGLFERGSTQALSVLTLGAPGLEQSLESMEIVGTKRFMHHYNFPPFSTGETGRMFTGRREIGHGSLAEKALLPVIPTKEEFPYVIRIVTEILSSNGSTSMASVCGSTLALMDAGVPIKKPVGGISI